MSTTSLTKSEIVDQYHRLYYESAAEGGTWDNTTFLGHKVWKMPSDLWLYQELLWEVRPVVVIETGTAYGGSALYLASILDQMSQGRVVSIDLKPINRNYPKHPRIAYLGGRSSVDSRVVAEVKRICTHYDGPVMVALDSDHSKEHVLKELAIYGGLVTPGSYLVVEDVNVNGHPVYPEHGPGPKEALDEWLLKREDYVQDHARATKLLYSHNAWLKRRRV